ncbi:MAG: alcohol dehydrogenase catalytic domain-containing protein, partial [Nitrospinota bacterium]|nr:alcohol dehydrogenase catalytic domain-containing protein [Nitrospinota bacterium]
MRALYFDKKLCYRTDYPEPQPKCNEALIRITMAGLCNTDIEIMKGYMDFQGVPGHEFVGTVEKSEEKKWEGKRVAGEINIGCGVCSYCLSRMRNHCPNRSVLGILKKDGVFADYITLPVRNLYMIPDSITDEEAVCIEPLAASFEISQQVNIKPNEKVCVLGDGKLGLLAGQTLSLTGCDLTVVGHHKEKLSILNKKGINTRTDKDINDKFDFVVDCTGSSSGLNKALSLVKPKGKIILKTTVANREPIDLNYLVINEIDL